MKTIKTIRFTWFGIIGLVLTLALLSAQVVAANQYLPDVQKDTLRLIVDQQRVAQGLEARKAMRGGSGTTPCAKPAPFIVDIYKDFAWDSPPNITFLAKNHPSTSKAIMYRTDFSMCRSECVLLCLMIPPQIGVDCNGFVQDCILGCCEETCNQYYTNGDPNWAYCFAWCLMS